MKPITVLGAGSWGTALALSLVHNGQATRLWGHNPQHIQALKDVGVNEKYLPGVPLPAALSLHDDLASALQDCSDILLVVLSTAFRATLLQAKAHITPETGICWGTKGIDHESGQLLDHVVKELCGANPVAVISGPSFAKEVAQGLPTAITLAAEDKHYAQHLQKRFHHKNFRVYLSNDLIGVQVSGTVKNVLAIATGICDGLGFGANARCALITRGLSEMLRLGVALGGKHETFMGLAGMGDLILTCTDNQSRNRRFGLALGQGKTPTTATEEINQVIEGVKNAAEVCRLAEHLQLDMPICQQVHKVVIGNISAKQAVKNLLSREPRAEM